MIFSPLNGIFVLSGRAGTRRTGTGRVEGSGAGVGWVWRMGFVQFLLLQCLLVGLKDRRGLRCSMRRNQWYRHKVQVLCYRIAEKDWSVVN